MTPFTTTGPGSDARAVRHFAIARIVDPPVVLRASDTALMGLIVV
jgi:hypothetical protein